MARVKEKEAINFRVSRDERAWREGTQEVLEKGEGRGKMMQFFFLTKKKKIKTKNRGQRQMEISLIFVH